MSRIITQYDMASAMQVRGANTYSPYLWDDLLLWLPFLRGKNDPRDWSGNGHTLVASGTPVWSQHSGVWPHTIAFDGSSDYYTSSLSLPATLPYTVTFRMRPNMGASTSQYTAVGVGTRRAMGVDDSTDKLWCTGESNEYGSTTVTAAEHSASFVWTSSGIRMYLDGVYDATGNADTTDSGTVYIGQRGGNLQMFDGRLWDVRIHMRELSVSEIAEIHQQPCRAATPRPAQVYFNRTAPPVQTAKTPIPLFTGVH